MKNFKHAPQKDKQPYGGRGAELPAERSRAPPGEEHKKRIHEDGQGPCQETHEGFGGGRGTQRREREPVAGKEVPEKEAPV